VQVTALFFVLFVLSGIITENVFELFAAAILDALVLARVLFYLIAKKNKHFRGRLVMLGFITGFQVIVLVRCLHGSRSNNPAWSQPIILWPCAVCVLLQRGRLQLKRLHLRNVNLLAPIAYAPAELTDHLTSPLYACRC